MWQICNWSENIGYSVCLIVNSNIICLRLNWIFDLIWYRWLSWNQIMIRSVKTRNWIRIKVSLRVIKLIIVFYVTITLTLEWLFSIRWVVKSWWWVWFHMITVQIKFILRKSILVIQATWRWVIPFITFNGCLKKKKDEERYRMLAKKRGWEKEV